MSSSTLNGDGQPGEDLGPDVADRPLVAHPALNALALGAFLAYATVRLFCRTNYWVDDFHYLAPFYSPCLSTDCVRGHLALLGSRSAPARVGVPCACSS